MRDHEQARVSTYIHTYIHIDILHRRRAVALSVGVVHSVCSYSLPPPAPHPLSSSPPSLSYQLPPCLQPSSSTSSYVCMYVYMYIYVCKHVCVYIYTHTYMHIHIYIYVYIHTSSLSIAFLFCLFHPVHLPLLSASPCLQ